MSGLTGHWWLILIILAIVLIIWGPGKLPDVGAGMGRAIREFRKASTETHDTIMQSVSGQPAPQQQPQSPPPPPVSEAPPAPPAYTPPPQTPVSR